MKPDRMRWTPWISVGCWLLATLASCSKETSAEAPGHRLDIRFRPMADGIPLHYGDTCANPQGETYRPGMFRIYLGDISLSDEAGIQTHFTGGYHLLDAGDSASLTVRLHGGARPFRRIAFQVGVDSARNVSGAQTGALDPVHGMFWTWNTGYINIRLEGTSAVSDGPGGRFEYHIGGFRSGEATRRTVALDLPAGQSHRLEVDGRSEAWVDIDLDRFFRSAHDLPIAAAARVTAPGPLAVRYADNAARMFILSAIVRR